MTALVVFLKVSASFSATCVFHTRTPSRPTRTSFWHSSTDQSPIRRKRDIVIGVVAQALAGQRLMRGRRRWNLRKINECLVHVLHLMFPLVVIAHEFADAVGD